MAPTGTLILIFSLAGNPTFLCVCENITKVRLFVFLWLKLKICVCVVQVLLMLWGPASAYTVTLRGQNASPHNVDHYILR